MHELLNDTISSGRLCHSQQHYRASNRNFELIISQTSWFFYLLLFFFYFFLFVHFFSQIFLKIIFKLLLFNYYWICQVVVNGSYVTRPKLTEMLSFDSIELKKKKEMDTTWFGLISARGGHEMCNDVSVKKEVVSLVCVSWGVHGFGREGVWGLR